MTHIYSNHELKAWEGLIELIKLARQEHYESCCKEVWVRSKSRHIHGSTFTQRTANYISNDIIKGPTPGSGNTGCSYIREKKGIQLVSSQKLDVKNSTDTHHVYL